MTIEEQVQKFTPVKLNKGIDIERYGSETRKKVGEQNKNKLQEILNSFKETQKQEKHENVPSSSSLPPYDYDKEIFKIKEQQEKDKELFNCVVKEQREKIKQLEKELAYLNEINQKLESENSDLSNKIYGTNRELEKESSKLVTAMQRISDVEQEFIMLKKERDKFRDILERCNGSLQATISLLKSLLGTFVGCLNVVFGTKASASTAKDNQSNTRENLE